MGILFVAGTAGLVIAWLLLQPVLLERRRQRAASRPFLPQWREILHRRMPLYSRLPAGLRARLERHIQVFLAEKRFAGCGGFEVTDEVRLIAAAHACLLVVNRPLGQYAKLSQVLVYPGAFIVERVRPEPSGVLQETRQVLSGESWTHGQVVLSWEAVLEGVANPQAGRNVALHEFAHQLDQENGHANGAPALPRREHYRSWSRILGQEFARLRLQVALGEATLLDAYGASDPAEFFAVATEVFFGQPGLLAAAHPALYAQLRAFYAVDPASWGPESE